MGIEHTKRPIWGVQFHPESIATEHGRAIAENFYAMASRLRNKPLPRTAGRRADNPLMAGENGPSAAGRRGLGESAMRLRLRALDGEPSTEHLFERLFGEEENAFWLDSVDAPTRLAQGSYMGTSAGRDRCLLSYDVEAGEVAVERARRSTVEQKSIFDLLDREIAKHAVAPPGELARGLIGGFVGYLGYELKADCGSPNVHSSDMPDALMMLANRVIAVDHVRSRTYVCAVAREDDAEADAWVEMAATAVAETLADPPAPVPMPDPENPVPHVSFQSGRGREQYLADIAHSQSELAAGESYEVCLTDQFSTDASPDPFVLYRHLRRSNPAPFAAYLKFGERAIVSSSPERFLSVDRERRVEARPIKGTISRSDDPVVDAARRAELADDEKTMAEHLMIVDLLRNDVGRVCDVDSVSVPELMAIEPYATVHQMVSTIQGYLEPDRSPVECVHSCFPGGSMTGAPKLRTMEIIDGIEDEARGVYSGAIGYFGLDGSTDLSIVIRTIVMRPGRTTIGAGGAIVMQSDPVDEFDEILLKARAPMAAVARVATGREDPDAWSVELEPAPHVLGRPEVDQGHEHPRARAAGAA
jgi:para-aminobenzoate synthetase